MPPKPKITKAMILRTVLEITREMGFEAVNARRIADRLCCSTRPIFTCYENMDELKGDFLAYAFAYYSQYEKDYKKSKNAGAGLFHPLSYIEFAREETNLFQLLFISHMDLNMTEGGDFYREPGNVEKAAAFSEEIGVLPERGKRIFLNLFFYAHGIAVLTAAGKLSLDRGRCEAMLAEFLSAYTGGEKEGRIQ